mmetsp:Transcript_90888/g.166833  ORF Transcript_90888/g.166833 Transcript_90888/m.166833 type:complete len:187 (-) Transcript_90888:182-742(-)
MAPSRGSSAKNARKNNSGCQRQQAAGQSIGISAAKGTSKQSDAAVPKAGLQLVATAATLAKVRSAPYLGTLDDVENLPWRFGRIPTFSWNGTQKVIQDMDPGVYEPSASFVKLLICAACGSSENLRPHLILNQLLHATISILLLHWLSLIVARPLPGFRGAAQSAPCWAALHPLRAQALACRSCQP